MAFRLFLALCGLIAIAATAEATLITNGGFEEPGFDSGFRTYGSGSTELTGWTVDGAGIVHVGTFWQHASGEHSVELNLFASGGISQTIVTAPGQAYQLEFDMSAQPNLGPTVKEMQIFWGGALVNTSSFNVSGHTLASMGWEHRVVALPAATGTSTVLRFYGSVAANSDGGPALDNVSLVEVPEPSTLALATAIACVLSVRTRRIRRRSR